MYLAQTEKAYKVHHITGSDRPGAKALCGVKNLTTIHLMGWIGAASGHQRVCPSCRKLCKE